MHHRSLRIGSAAVALLACATLAAAAQGLDDKRKPPKPKPDCLDGVVYDDNKLESGLRPSDFADPGDFVMLMEAPSYPAKLNKACIAWRRTSFWSTLYFNLRIWAADGPDGAPGTLLAEVGPFAAFNVPTKAKFYSYDLSGAGIVIDGPVYIGPSWNGLRDGWLIYLGMDQGPRTARRRGFYGAVLTSNQVEPPTHELGISLEYAPSYRAFGIRGVFGPP
jgi:hypothetical protein